MAPRMSEHPDFEDLFEHSAPAGKHQTAEPVATVASDQPTHDSIGACLRTAREGRGLSLADCGRDLHLPIKVLQRIEQEDFGDPDNFVFLRGALTGYAKYLGLPPGSCDDALRAAAPVAQPELVSVARTSHTRWLLQRYGTAATYIVLTALIAVPLVLLGLRGGLHRPTARIVSLDHPAVSAPAPTSSATSATTTLATNDSPDATPFRASIAPFAAIDINDGTSQGDADATSTAIGAATSAPVPAATSGSGHHALTITATADCWFEITDADGNKVDSGMLHVGDSRTWHSQGVLHVTLGNADGVSVTRDGQPLALDAYQHANVARFDVFGPAGASEND